MYRKIEFIVFLIMIPLFFGARSVQSQGMLFTNHHCFLLFSSIVYEIFFSYSSSSVLSQYRNPAYLTSFEFQYLLLGFNFVYSLSEFYFSQIVSFIGKILLRSQRKFNSQQCFCQISIKWDHLKINKWDQLVCYRTATHLHLKKKKKL